MSTRTTEPGSPSRTGDGAGTRRTDDPFLAACAQYESELLAAARRRRPRRLRGPERDLLQRALLLSYLLDTCRTENEAWERLRQLGQGSDGVGSAARQLGTLLADCSARQTAEAVGGPVSRE